jgi:hypothetical protein
LPLPSTLSQAAGRAQINTRTESEWGEGLIVSLHLRDRLQAPRKRGFVRGPRRIFGTRAGIRDEVFCLKTQNEIPIWE